MILKKPCGTSMNDEQNNCSLLGETDSIGLMTYNQNKYLGLYSMNIVTGCVCFIISIVLLYYVTKWFNYLFLIYYLTH